MLFDAIRRHVESKADVQLGRYVGPYGQGGLQRLQRLGSDVEFIARGPARRTWTPGAVLAVGSPLGGPGRVILQDPPPGQIGSSAHQVSRPQILKETGSPLIFGLQPGVYRRGKPDQPASLFGAGFQSNHSVAITRFDGGAGRDVIDERFTVHQVEVIDAGQIDFLLDVASEVPAGTLFDAAIILP